jgi:transglutaminase-like putative cysteine protease
MSERLDAHAFDLLCLACGAAIAAHLPRLPLWLSLPLVVLVPLRAVLRRRASGTVGAWLRLPLAVLLLVAIVVHYGNVFGRDAGSALAVGLLGLKLLEAERVRDARVALGFAAFVLMSALLFTQTLGFTLALCLALVLLLAALAALQPAPLQPRRRWRSEFRLGALLLGAGIPLALAGFVLVPRLGSPLWGAPNDSALARTGLGDRMAPGSLTELLIDDSPAMRVRFDGPPPPPQSLYFRAVVLPDFDGSAWTRGRGRGYLRPGTVHADGPPVTTTITLEPTDRRWLPALDLPLAGIRGARLGSDHTLVSFRRITAPHRYSVTSTLRYAVDLDLTASERKRALALPPGYDPRARALAAQWRAQDADPLAIMRAALARFRADFTYTLTPPPLGRDSIDDFLFDTHAGFCEHYASAFTFLMRAAGIPARVVTGYQGGWWNDEADYLLVRQSDAHAWSEIWLEGRGWVRVDPTAAVSPARVELGAAAANDSGVWYQAGWLRAVRNRLDLVNRLWTESVVQFNALGQRRLLVPFGGGLLKQADLLLGLGIALIAVLAAATVWAMRSGERRRGDALDQAWARFGRRLARSGVTPRASEGPLDLLARASRHLPQSRPALEPLIRRYAALRYGCTTPPAEQVRELGRALRRWRAQGRDETPPVAVRAGDAPRIPAASPSSPGKRQPPA